MRMLSTEPLVSARAITVRGENVARGTRAATVGDDLSRNRLGPRPARTAHAENPSRPWASAPRTMSGHAWVIGWSPTGDRVRSAPLPSVAAIRVGSVPPAPSGRIAPNPLRRRGLQEEIIALAPKGSAQKCATTRLQRCFGFSRYLVFIAGPQRMWDWTTLFRSSVEGEMPSVTLFPAASPAMRASLRCF
jgi:hypothetical protein